MKTPHYAFEGKRVVVTGAASGIGHRTTELLLEAGAHVVALDRNAVDLKVAQFVQVDMTKPDTIAAAAKAIDGDIDVLLNIAGVPGTADPGPVRTPILKDFRESIGPMLDLVTRETGRDATVDDIARVMLFISDPVLQWLNATDVQVDGGFMSGLVGGWVKLGS